MHLANRVRAGRRSVYKPASAPLGAAPSAFTARYSATRVCWRDRLGSRTCACSCMLSQTTAGRPRFAHSSPPPCSRSLRLYFETHMPAVTQHVPILSDLVLGSADRSATRPFLNLKRWNQTKVCCAHSLQSDWVLTQFSLGSGSLSAKLADLYHLPIHWPLPLFGPPVTVGPTEPHEWLHFSNSPHMPVCPAVLSFTPLCFPDIPFSHVLVEASHMSVRGVRVFVLCVS